LEEKRTISQFKDLAYSGTYRSDGKLIVAGEETGVVQVRCMEVVDENIH
jgi:U3 small nucleolar RNA-associated protein 15